MFGSELGRCWPQEVPWPPGGPPRGIPRGVPEGVPLRVPGGGPRGEEGRKGVGSSWWYPGGCPIHLGGGSLLRTSSLCFQQSPQTHPQSAPRGVRWGVPWGSPWGSSRGDTPQGVPRVYREAGITWFRMSWNYMVSEKWSLWEVVVFPSDHF